MDRPELQSNFSFKDPKELITITMIHPKLLLAFAEIVIWAKARNLPIVITRAVAWEIPGVSKSTTHSEGRAIDLSVNGWSADQITDAVNHFNEKFESIGAISAESGKSTFMYYHNAGKGWHLHIQIRRGL